MGTVPECEASLQLAPVLLYRYTSACWIIFRQPHATPVSAWHNLFVSSHSSISALHFNPALLTSSIYKTFRFHVNTAVNSVIVAGSTQNTIQKQNKLCNVSKMLNQMSQILPPIYPDYCQIFCQARSRDNNGAYSISHCWTNHYTDRNNLVRATDRLLPTKHVLMIYI